MVQDIEDRGAVAPQERRASSRAQTFREILFSAWEGRPKWGRGTAVDISPSGLRIHTAAPAEVGSRLEIEMPPKPGAFPEETSYVRGEVVWKEKLPSGEWAMGIQLNVQLPLGGKGALAGNRQAQELLAQVAVQLRALENAPSAAAGPESPGVSSPLPLMPESPRAADVLQALLEPIDGEEAARGGDTGTEISFRSASERRRRVKRWAAALIGLFLLAGGLFFLLSLYKGTSLPRVEWVGEPGPGMRTVSGGEEAVPAAVTKKSNEKQRGGSGARRSGKAAPGMGGPEIPIPALLYQAQADLELWEPEAARQTLDGLLKRNDLAPVERFAGRISLALAQQIGGEASAARSTLAVALAEPENVPEAWISLGEHCRKLLAAGLLNNLGPLLFRNAVEIAPLEKALPQETPAPISGPASEMPPEETQSRNASGVPSPAPGIHIRVSAARYVLTVYNGDKPLGAFPIGLGENGSTPRGEFRITNKITNPDWYNRGNTVKSGDPQNPLGRRWMGLANQSGPTPYGIHPTNEPGSIGQDRSRGCIRMRPQDAEQVFTWCAVGTPVIIGE